MVPSLIFCALDFTTFGSVIFDDLNITGMNEIKQVNVPIYERGGSLQ